MQVVPEFGRDHWVIGILPVRFLRFSGEGQDSVDFFRTESEFGEDVPDCLKSFLASGVPTVFVVFEVHVRIFRLEYPEGKLFNVCFLVLGEILVTQYGLKCYKSSIDFCNISLFRTLVQRELCSG